MIFTEDKTNKLQTEVIKNLSTIISQKANSIVKDNSPIKTISGTAQSVEDINGFVNVQLVGENQILSFLNKSSELISIGDTVVIEYKKSLSNGIIKRRIGRTKYGCFVIVNSEEEAKVDFIPDRLYIVLDTISEVDNG